MKDGGERLFQMWEDKLCLRVSRDAGFSVIPTEECEKQSLEPQGGIKNRKTLGPSFSLQIRPVDLWQGRSQGRTLSWGEVLMGAFG